MKTHVNFKIYWSYLYDLTKFHVSVGMLFQIHCFKTKALSSISQPLLKRSNFHPNFQTFCHDHIIRLNITNLKICQLCSGAITALTSSRSFLISASEDCSICIWDIFSWEITRRFSLQKGHYQSNYIFILYILW